MKSTLLEVSSLLGCYILSLDKKLMMFCSILVTTSSGSSSQKKSALEDKVYCIGTGIDESERTGCVVGQVMAVVLTGTGWGLGVMAVMGE
jgi:hypothetical protein